MVFGGDGVGKAIEVEEWFCGADDLVVELVEFVFDFFEDE